jgi:nicotinamidase-related amidase
LYRPLDLPLTESVILEAKKTALIIIDMQNDYCKRDGKAFAPEYESVIAPIRTLLIDSKRSGVPVIYTQNWLADVGGYWSQAYEREETVVPVHCLQNTWGADIIDELKPARGDLVIRKTHYNMFLGELRHEADEAMTRFRAAYPAVDTFMVTGLDANVCVFFNSDSLFSLGYRLVLLQDCIGGSPTFRAEKADVGYDHSIWFLSRLNGARITASYLLTLKP